MKKGLILCLAFMLLVYSSAFAVTVEDIKPDDRVEDLRILAPYTLYKEKISSTLLQQPFFSYEDVDAYILVYNSSIVESPKGYDLMVLFEDWKNEIDSKNRFEKDFSFEGGFQECDMMFNGRVKKCEQLGYPQVVYVLYYQNFIIRAQPYPDYPFTAKELFYLSFDMQKLIKNILSKISKFENPVEKETIIPEEETMPIETGSPAEEKQISEESKPGFFSRNRNYILGVIGLLLIGFLMYRAKDFLNSIFILILGLIILNGFIGFTRNEVITWALLWIMTYFFFKWFYVANIKKNKRIRKEYLPQLEKSKRPRRIFLY